MTGRPPGLARSVSIRSVRGVSMAPGRSGQRWWRGTKPQRHTGEGPGIAHRRGTLAGNGLEELRERDGSINVGDSGARTPAISQPAGAVPAGAWHRASRRRCTGSGGLQGRGATRGSGSRSTRRSAWGAWASRSGGRATGVQHTSAPPGPENGEGVVAVAMAVATGFKQSGRRGNGPRVPVASSAAQTTGSTRSANSASVAGAGGP